MGRGRRSGAWRATAVSVLGPLAPPVVLALSASLAAAAVDGAPLRDGAWEWLGDTAFVLDGLAALAVLGVPATLRRERVRRAAVVDVDEMTGEEFEGRLARLFGDLGYDVRRTGASGDFGADLLLELDGERAVAQAKRYDGAVGIEAVQQVIGATRYYDAARAFVVTNSSCTAAATALAAAHDVELVERESLVTLLAAHPLPEDRSTTGVRLAREVGAGAVLVLFAVAVVLRLLWRGLCGLSPRHRRPRRARPLR